MITYYLHTHNLDRAFGGSYSECEALGGILTARGDHELLKIAKARPGERDALVVTDITADSVKQTGAICTVSAKTLRRLCRSSTLAL